MKRHRSLSQKQALSQNPSPLKIALVGYSGKMGKSLQKLIKKSPLFERTAKACHEDCFASWDSKNIQAVIDFSSPELCLKSLKWCLNHKKAFVSGTTGLNSKQKQILKQSSQSIPVFYSENMSMGIHLFSQWMQAINSTDFQFLLEDYHHKDKKDKPSGTAIRLTNHLPPAIQKKIKIKSYRKGKEFGTHRVILKSKEEILTLEHKALNRDVFSKGALKAVQFIIKKRKGFYDVKDLYSSLSLTKI